MYEKAPSILPPLHPFELYYILVQSRSCWIESLFAIYLSTSSTEAIAHDAAQSPCLKASPNSLVQLIEAFLTSSFSF
jgi:hypothetical protein